MPFYLVNNACKVYRAASPDPNVVHGSTIVWAWAQAFSALGVLAWLSDADSVSLKMSSSPYDYVVHVVATLVLALTDAYHAAQNITQETTCWLHWQLLQKSCLTASRHKTSPIW